jgi:GT2 family glycosyltransferase
MAQHTVSVTIVTHNSRRFIRPCLEAVFEQSYPPTEVIVVDNASVDYTFMELARYRDRVRVIRNSSNTGFARAQNQAIQASRGDWVLTLNPDVKICPGFIEGLIAAARTGQRTGTVCGKLLSIEPGFAPPAEARIDSTGIYFTPSMRHFDRGSGEPDDGRFSQVEDVFGACAAAAFYRRDMIADVACHDGFFDPDFFAYREDADVAWRAQLLGWRCLYTPHAVGYHVRSVRPGSRRKVPAMLNMHSVKNRFLMRIKNLTGDLHQRCWPAMLGRDLLVIGGCLFYEPSSLPALWRTVRCLPSALAKRREILGRRRVTDDYLASWFQPQPGPRLPAKIALAR